MLQRVIKPLRELFRHEQWNIGIVHAPIHAFLRGGGDLPPVRWFPRAPRGQFLADPFGFQQNGSLYVFYEHFDYSRFNGWLVALKTDRDFAKWESHDVMPQSVHASYPFLLEHAGQLYCIPETQKAGEVKLYRSERLPDKWEFVATLIRGFPAVDPTIVWHDGRWWLFAVSGEQGADDQLHIWHAADLLGPWQAHKKNPVKIDKSSARPGGTPFVHEDSFIVLRRTARARMADALSSCASQNSPRMNSPKSRPPRSRRSRVAVCRRASHHLRGRRRSHAHRREALPLHVRRLPQKLSSIKRKVFSR
jgi:hypothetical protein